MSTRTRDAHREQYLRSLQQAAKTGDYAMFSPAANAAVAAIVAAALADHSDPDMAFAQAWPEVEDLDHRESSDTAVREAVWAACLSLTFDLTPASTRTYVAPIGGGSMVVCGDCRDLDVAVDPTAADLFEPLPTSDIDELTAPLDGDHAVCGACGTRIGVGQ